MSDQEVGIICRDKVRQDKARQDKTRQNKMHSLLKSLSVNIASLATMRAGPWRGDMEASRRDTEGWVFSSSIIITLVAPKHQGRREIGEIGEMTKNRKKQ